METIDEKRLRILKKKLALITGITVKDMKKHPEAEIVVRTAKRSLDYIIRYVDKEKSINAEFKILK